MKKAIEKLNKRIERLTAKKENLEAKIQESIKLRNIYCKDNCWCCSKTGPTTELSACEIANPNYPMCCN